MTRAKDIIARVTSGLHRTIYEVSGGRLLGSVFGMQVLELETIGRRSGKARKTMLTAPLSSDERMVLVASYGGDDNHPAWFLNLRANPRVKVTANGETQSMTACVATEEEKADLWPQVTAAYPGYAGYQDKTDRDIPLVILTPESIS